MQIGCAPSGPVRGNLLPGSATGAQLGVHGLRGRRTCSCAAIRVALRVTIGLPWVGPLMGRYRAASFRRLRRAVRVAVRPTAGPARRALAVSCPAARATRAGSASGRGRCGGPRGTLCVHDQEDQEEPLHECFFGDFSVVHSLSEITAGTARMP